VVPAGVFGGGTATRAYSVPEGKPLFFPVINSFNNNTPDCGQGGENFDVKKLISLITSSIDAAHNLSVTVDGKPHYSVSCRSRFRRRFRETTFSDPIPPLKVGPHTLQFHAESGTFSQDVTYNLTVVPVSLK
jgi:hypothetical protein